jgi:glycerophosphoryl diester phosphodiesterase
MKVIGHRGARGLAPENTIASFREALAAGVDEIELDARVTSDGVVVLHHDPFLRDASGGKLRHVIIREQTLVALRSHRPDLTTLDEAIDLINREVPIIVEVKPGVPLDEVIAILKQCLQNGWQSTDFLLASFSQRTLKQLHAALPDVEIIVNERFSGLRATFRARQVGTKRIAMNQRNLWWGFVASMNRHDYHLTAYTLNDPHRAERWARHGLYGVVTDFPDRFTHQHGKAKG